MRRWHSAQQQNRLVLTSRFTGYLIQGALCANAEFRGARFLVVVSGATVKERFRPLLDLQAPWIDAELGDEEKETLRKEAEQLCCCGGPPVNGVLEL